MIEPPLIILFGYHSTHSTQEDIETLIDHGFSAEDIKNIDLTNRPSNMDFEIFYDQSLMAELVDNSSDALSQALLNSSNSLLIIQKTQGELLDNEMPDLQSSWINQYWTASVVYLPYLLPTLMALVGFVLFIRYKNKISTKNNT